MTLPPLDVRHWNLVIPAALLLGCGSIESAESTSGSATSYYTTNYSGDGENLDTYDDGYDDGSWYAECYVDDDCGDFQECVDDYCEDVAPAIPICANAPQLAAIPLPDSIVATAAVTTANFDGDPEDELVYLGGQGLHIMLGIDDPAPTTIVDDGIVGVAVGHATLDAGDSQDIVLDLAVGAGIAVYLNDGAANFSPAVGAPDVGDTRNTVSGDFDGDGLTDLATQMQGGAQLWMGDGLGGLAQGELLDAYSLAGLASAKISADPSDDLVLEPMSHQLAWIERPGNVEHVIDEGTFSHDILLTADLDGDQNTDVVGLSTIDDWVAIRVWIGTGMDLQYYFIGAVGTSYADAAVGDVDGSGLPDLVLVGDGATLTIVFDPAGLTPPCMAAYASIGAVHDVAVGDVDGDARDEIFITNIGELAGLEIE